MDSDLTIPPPCLRLLLEVDLTISLPTAAATTATLDGDFEILPPLSSRLREGDFASPVMLGDLMGEVAAAAERDVLTDAAAVTPGAESLGVTPSGEIDDCVATASTPAASAA